MGSRSASSTIDALAEAVPFQYARAYTCMNAESSACEEEAAAASEGARGRAAPIVLSQPLSH